MKVGNRNALVLALVAEVGVHGVLDALVRVCELKAGAGNGYYITGVKLEHVQADLPVDVR